MAVSIFDLFTIGIGPSSSHTVGPMKAAKSFVITLKEKKSLPICQAVTVDLYGSLALTGIGHGTDVAILLGLSGYSPESVDLKIIPQHIASIKKHQQICLLNETVIAFDTEQSLRLNPQQSFPFHPNAMQFAAYDQNHELLLQCVYYSIGGGFIVEEGAPEISESLHKLPFHFETAAELLKLCETHQLSIADLMWQNEISLQNADFVQTKLLEITDVMLACIDAGCQHSGHLPGGLNIPRRAPTLYQKLLQKGKPRTFEHVDSMEWLNLFAIAVNEENAAGGRVVTAPTNGAAGIVPAVLKYFLTFYPEAKKIDAIPYLLTAAAIALLYKKRASLSGAEVGCQGEVGVACSMAAGALTAILGGNIYQIENAAEIAMEHHLGMTCDPIRGLVQIPCIERNAMGAVKAVNAARLALLGDGSHFVSLDKVIATMKQTGLDMMSIYKETSLGGLAVNHTEC